MIRMLTLKEVATPHRYEFNRAVTTENTVLARITVESNNTCRKHDYKG